MVKKRGFTLIELLVVIAVIGILASMLLVALRTARDKAQDARIKSSLGQIRTLAEMVYVASGAYTSLTLDSDYGILATDIGKQGGTLNITNIDIKTFAIDSTLNAVAGSHWCVDSQGLSIAGTASPTGCSIP